MGRSFDQLRVYQLSEELADTVWDVVQPWAPLATFTVGKQMISSADSVGANIAEGYGRGTYQDNRRFVRISRGSLYETRHWLRRAFKRRLLHEPDISKLQLLVDNLAPQLNAYLSSIGHTTND